jgi:hypothetical protein
VVRSKLKAMLHKGEPATFREKGAEVNKMEV